MTAIAELQHEWIDAEPALSAAEGPETRTGAEVVCESLVREGVASDSPGSPASC